MSLRAWKLEGAAVIQWLLFDDTGDRVCECFQDRIRLRLRQQAKCDRHPTDSCACASEDPTVQEAAAEPIRGNVEASMLPPGNRRRIRHKCRDHATEPVREGSLAAIEASTHAHRIRNRRCTGREALRANTIGTDLSHWAQAGPPSGRPIPQPWCA